MGINFIHNAFHKLEKETEMNFNEKKQYIPKDLYEPFDRLINLVPVSFRNDKYIHQTILEYLELKGEKFVRDGIKLTRKNFYGKLREKTLSKQFKS